jgi:hypothetical protein
MNHLPATVYQAIQSWLQNSDLGSFAATNKIAHTTATPLLQQRHQEHLDAAIPPSPSVTLTLTSSDSDEDYVRARVLMSRYVEGN